MQHLEVSSAVRHIYIYVVRWQRVKRVSSEAVQFCRTQRHAESRVSGYTHLPRVSYHITISALENSREKEEKYVSNENRVPSRRFVWLAGCLSPSVSGLEVV
jgi:hypothetical protein